MHFTTATEDTPVGSIAPFDISALLSRWTLGDKLQRLALLSPSDLVGIELIVDDALIKRWPLVFLPAASDGPRDR